MEDPVGPERRVQSKSSVWDWYQPGHNPLSKPQPFKRNLAQFQKDNKAYNAWSGLVSRSWNVSRHKNRGFRSSWQPLICDLQRVLLPLTGTRNLRKSNRPTSVNLEVMWPSLKWNSTDVRNNTWRRIEEYFCAGSFHYIVGKLVTWITSGKTATL